MLTKLKEHVLELCKNGERVCTGDKESQGHREAREYLAGCLQKSGVRPYAGENYKLPYQAGRETLHNLAAVIPGKNRSLKPILIGAHYDTCRRQPGADDNAAACALLLELIPLVQEAGLSSDLVLLFFDAEEPPHFHQPSMGSTWFYNHQKTGDFQTALILDLIGHDTNYTGLEDLVIFTGAESHLQLARDLDKTAVPKGMRILPILNRYIGDLSDHYVFRCNNVPYLLVTCGESEHYHKESDRPETLNYQKLTLLTKYLGRLIVSIDESKEYAPGQQEDSLELELKYFNRVITGLPGIPVRKFKSRDDIDMAASMVRWGLRD